MESHDIVTCQVPSQMCLRPLTNRPSTLPICFSQFFDAPFILKITYEQKNSAQIDISHSLFLLFIYSETKKKIKLQIQINCTDPPVPDSWISHYPWIPPALFPSVQMLLSLLPHFKKEQGIAGLLQSIPHEWVRVFKKAGRLKVTSSWLESSQNKHIFTASVTTGLFQSALPGFLLLLFSDANVFNLNFTHTWFYSRNRTP